MIFISSGSTKKYDCEYYNILVSKNTPLALMATSHARLRTRDQISSSTLIGGKGGAGPSSLHTRLKGPT